LWWPSSHRVKCLVMQSQVSYCHESGRLICLSLMNHSSHVSLYRMFHTIFCDIVLFLVLRDMYRLLFHILINRKEFKNETQAYFNANETRLTTFGAPCTLIQFFRPKRSIFWAQKVSTNLKNYSKKEHFVQIKQFCRYLLLWKFRILSKIYKFKKKVQNPSPLLFLTLRKNFSQGKN